jgi:hypothetical protein
VTVLTQPRPSILILEGWRPAARQAATLERPIIHAGAPSTVDSQTRVRARVEHCFGLIKRVSGFSKVRYRGLHKRAPVVCDLCTHQPVHHSSLQKKGLLIVGNGERERVTWPDAARLISGL